ncbi:MAG: cysteine desulfurase [Gemmatales bacterium]|nr:cysteine desulfurase [Gemmatales bacterium]MDW8222594.1 cysteine desulfurase family protein [Gemmatales bacterium]
MKPIYLDYNATTPVAPAVVEAMLPFLREEFGNPSSAHRYGQTAHHAVEQARRQVADLLGAQPQEIVFTSGGSEASNLAIKGIVFPLLFGATQVSCGLAGNRFLAAWQRWWRRLRPRKLHIITSAIEHPATLRPCAFLQSLGVRVSVLPVDRLGLVDLDALRRALRQPTALVTIMHANNEVGTLQPIREIARLAHEHGALVHTDAAQSVGKIACTVRELDVDLLSVAGHKLYAPKGIGVLYVREGLTLEPQIHGAGHERGRRAGTENVTCIVGLGAACALAQRDLPALSEKLRRLRDRLWQRLRNALGDAVVLHGHPDQRLPNTLNVGFVGCVGAELLQAVPQLAASTGSACHEGEIRISPVLQAMGVSQASARGAVRLSVGRFTSEEEIDQAAEALVQAAKAVARPASAIAVVPAAEKP